MWSLRRRLRGTELCVSSILPFFPSEMTCKRFGDCCDFDLIEERLDHARVLCGFSLTLLAWAIRNALDPKCIERCLKSFNTSTMKYSLKIPVLEGSIVPSLPILCYAVKRNSPEIVRILCKAGADPNATAQPSGLPCYPMRS